MQRHARWVRIAHGIVTVSLLTLAVTGVEILMVHPRLYWGEVGNDLTPALLELPISRNFGGYQSARTIHFFTFVGLLVFVLVHVAMVARSGFRRQVRSMTWGTDMKASALFTRRRALIMGGLASASAGSFSRGVRPIFRPPTAICCAWGTI